MTMIEAKVKRWGNSLGIVIPKEVAREQRLRENETLHLFIVKRSPVLVKDVFGMLKGKLKKPTQQIMDEIRAELYD